MINVKPFVYQNGQNVEMNMATVSSMVIMGDGSTTLEEEITKLEKGTSNENLLINTNFLNPVYQYGTGDLDELNSSEVGYSDSSYWIDRWYPAQGTTADNITNYRKEKGIYIENGLCQAVYGMSDYVGQVFTLSIGFEDGTISSVTGTLNAGAGNKISNDYLSFHFLTGISSGNADVAIVEIKSKKNGTGTSLTDFYAIQWAKFEKGEFSTQYQIPSYTEEELKCQRYYMRYGYKKVNDSSNDKIPYTLGLATSKTTGTVIFYLPTQMRITPTIKIVGTFNVQYPNANNSMLDSLVNSVEVAYVNSNQAIAGLDFSEGYSALTYGQIIAFYAYEGGAYICFDAEYHPIWQSR